MADKKDSGLNFHIGEIFQYLMTIHYAKEAIGGRGVPDDAPAGAQMAAGLFGKRDEVTYYKLLSILESKKEGSRARMHKFMKWLRERRKTETKLSRLLGWWYFNGFRSNLMQLHESSAGFTKETKKGKDGSQTTTTKPVWDTEEDLGLKFLAELDDIIVQHDESNEGYEKAVEFIKDHGFSVMPDTTKIDRWLEYLTEMTRQAPGVVKKTARSIDTWVNETHEEIAIRNGQKGWFERKLLKFMGSPVKEPETASKRSWLDRVSSVDWSNLLKRFKKS